MMRRLIRSAAFGLMITGVSLAANFVFDLGIDMSWVFPLATYGYYSGIADGERHRE